MMHLPSRNMALRFDQHTVSCCQEHQYSMCVYDIFQLEVIKCGYILIQVASKHQYLIIIKFREHIHECLQAKIVKLLNAKFWANVDTTDKSTKLSPDYHTLKFG